MFLQWGWEACFVDGVVIVVCSALMLSGVCVCVCCVLRRL